MLLGSSLASRRLPHSQASPAMTSTHRKLFSCVAPGQGEDPAQCSQQRDAWPAGDGSCVAGARRYVVTIGYLVIESRRSKSPAPTADRCRQRFCLPMTHGNRFGLAQAARAACSHAAPICDSGAVAERERALVASFGADGRQCRSVCRAGVHSYRSWGNRLAGDLITYPAVMVSRSLSPRAKAELLGLVFADRSPLGGTGTDSPGNIFVPSNFSNPCAVRT